MTSLSIVVDYAWVCYLRGPRMQRETRQKLICGTFGRLPAKSSRSGAAAGLRGQAFPCKVEMREITAAMCQTVPWLARMLRNTALDGCAVATETR